jgi:DNA-binding response OmpR family regulator
MNKKVLLADDSLTIQKVINITLANEPYDISVCDKTSELLSVIKSVRPALILLDFNLSEEEDGYSLCRKIKDEAPDSQVLVLYGTFDTVDEAKLKECGASDKIVKPFDGSKFIETCARLAAQSPEPSLESVEAQVDTSFDPDATAEIKPSEILSEAEEESLDSWSVNDSSSVSEVEQTTSTNQLDDMAGDWAPSEDLSSGLEGWEVEVPGVIESKAPSQTDQALEPAGIEIEDAELPSDEDLEYPDMDIEVDIDTPMADQEEPTSQLVSADTLKPQPEIEAYNDDFTIEGQETGTSSEEEIANIESQIEDEVGADLWEVDEVSISSDLDSEDHDDSSNIDEVDMEQSVSDMIEPIEDHALDLEALEEEAQKEQEEKQQAEMAELDETDLDELEEEPSEPTDFPVETRDDIEGDSLDLAALEEEAKKEQEEEIMAETQKVAGPIESEATTVVDPEKIISDFEPHIKEAVEEYLQREARNIAEKVLWEIMPDIAENVVREELQKISKEIESQDH